MLQFTPMKGRI
jgi:hypothetical protein